MPNCPTSSQNTKCFHHVLCNLFSHGHNPLSYSISLLANHNPLPYSVCLYRSQNIRLRLALDGFSLFSHMSTLYSLCSVVLIPYNLLPWRHMKELNFFMSLLIPGPRSPSRKIDVYLQPLIEELEELWNSSVRTYESLIDQFFQFTKPTTDKLIFQSNFILFLHHFSSKLSEYFKERVKEEEEEFRGLRLKKMKKFMQSQTLQNLGATINLWFVLIGLSYPEGTMRPRGNRPSLQTGKLDKTVIFQLSTLSVLRDNDAVLILFKMFPTFQVEIELPMPDTLPTFAESFESNSSTWLELYFESVHVEMFCYLTNQVMSGLHLVFNISVGPTGSLEETMSVASRRLLG
ncbi:uncharacterized protein E6C27_scaffold102G00750 [Cucumis melo var. makuwa]|uniref:Uncharacterized protein n=1 Tax=Cucumis melo var. makuwa TaxID=1194695 RepID=A0A5A7UGD0_CUCMM|nr:uncharacterized protein E6C27_scaffold102G00750 [Cucumis melo var. makuwa]